MSEIKEDFKKSDAQEVLHSHYEKTRTLRGAAYAYCCNNCTINGTFCTFIRLNRSSLLEK